MNQPEGAQLGFTARIGVTTMTVVPPLLIVLALFGAWELYVELSGINAVTLPAPSRVAEAGWRAREVLWDNSLVTLKETAIGLAFSIVFAVALWQLGPDWGSLVHQAVTVD